MAIPERTSKSEEPVIKAKISEKVVKCFSERVSMASVKGNPGRILYAYLVC